MFEKINKKTVVDQVKEQIKNSVIKGNLQPGDRIGSERELAEKLGVGRPAIREAFQELDALGLLIKKQSGAYINDDPSAIYKDPLICKILLNRSNIKELFEARKLIETNGVNIIIKRINESEINSLKSQVAYMKQIIGNEKLLTEADVQFHLSLMKATKNQTLVNILHTLMGVVRWRIIKYMGNDMLTKKAIDFHERIVEAIEDKDDERASKIIEQHLVFVEDSLDFNN